MKKFLPYIFIGLVLGATFYFHSTATAAPCTSFDPETKLPLPTGCNPNEGPPIELVPSSPSPTPDSNIIEQNLQSCINLVEGSVEGCIQRIFYILFIQLPSFLMTQAALFLNIMIPISLGSKLYTSSSFVGTAWAIIRDISNIFFILILLYIGIQTILGIGHGTKKMIAQVVVMALLINFSMFFTKIVIDTSNILALIFYNKISVETVDRNGVAKPVSTIPILDPAKTGLQEKEIAGGLAASFNPNTFLTEDFFTKVKNQTQIVREASLVSKLTVAGGTAALVLGGPVTALVGTVVAGREVIGYFIGTQHIPIGLMLGIIVLSGSIMAFAAYAFFISAMSFLGRLIQLWVLIIVSPFAFMSFALPALSKLEWAGWNSWLKKLLETAFMAPVFMFMLYLIFLLVKANPFSNLADRSYKEQGSMEALLLLLLPALLIIIMLRMATKYAQKGSGQVGEMLIGAGKAAVGLALGGAALGGAVVGRNVLGRGAAALSSRDVGGHYGKAWAEYDLKLKQWQSKKPERRGDKPEWGQHLREYQAREDVHVGPPGVRGYVGALINKSQQKVRTVGHAEHEMDQVKEKAGLKNVEMWRMSEIEKRGMENAYYKINKSEIESQIKAGTDSKGNRVKLHGAQLQNESEYKSSPQNIERVKDEIRAEGRNAETPEGDLTNEAKERLNAHFGNYLRQNAKNVSGERYEELVEENKIKVGLTERVASKSTGGSYDARALADLAVKAQSGAIAKFATVMTLATAAGIRAGLKQAGVNFGTPKGSFFPDLSNTIGEALKSAKINIDVSKVAEEHKEDKHGGGGHH